MEHKTFPAFQIKLDADQGIVEHVVAVFGNIDLGGDIIHPGAFTKTIRERGTKIRCLDQHKTDSILAVIGKPLEIREISRAQLPPDVQAANPDATGGLYVKTKFLLDTPEGAGAFARIKAGAVDEYSIGYDAMDSDYGKTTKDGKEMTVRNLRTIKLWEYSPVVFGMNPVTVTLSAKEAPFSEAKPWRAIREGDTWRVYKLDGDGNPTGDMLGEHESEAQAQAQVRALYASEAEDNPKAAPAVKSGRRMQREMAGLLAELSGIAAKLQAWANYEDGEPEDENEPEEEPESDAPEMERAACRPDEDKPKAAAGPVYVPPTETLRLIDLELAELATL